MRRGQRKKKKKKSNKEKKKRVKEQKDIIQLGYSDEHIVCARISFGRIKSSLKSVIIYHVLNLFAVIIVI